MILKFILRDFRNNPWFFFFFILNFAIGLTGFVAIDSFKSGIQSSLKANSKEYLSADIALSARRKLTDLEIQTAKNFFQEKKIETIKDGKVLEFFTMAASGMGSRLVQLKAVDETYPMYGKMILQKNTEIMQGSPKEINSSLKAWVYPELLTQLNLKLGDQIKVGNIEFEISDVIVEDSTQTFRLAALAPKIYIGLQNAEKTGLLQMGSTLTEARLFQLNTNQNLSELKTELLQKFQDPALQVSSPEDAAEDSGRVVGYLNDYLGLVSLVGLFLAMIGATYLFRSFLNAKVQTIAIYNVLGLNFQTAFWISILQLVMTGFVASILSILFAEAVIPFIQTLVDQLSAAKIEATLQLQSVLVAVFVSILGILFSGLPYLISLRRIQTSELMQETVRLNLPMKTRDYIYFLPLGILFYVLSILQANSFKVGSIFFAALLGSFLILFLFVLLFLKILSSLTILKSQNFRQAVLYVTRKRNSTIPAILSLAVAALLLNLIPQLKTGLLEEFKIQKETKIPGLFLFDIQDEQIDGIKKIVNSEGLELNNLSPMVRARILSVNGQPFEKAVSGNQVFKTREEETEARFRNRGFNLSYREKLTSAEKIVGGKFSENKFDSAIQKTPEISIEIRFAERLNFKLGDLLKFDIQGVEQEGTITSLRSVKWNSFQPNFFVLFQAGVLDEAPKSWLASIVKLDLDRRNQLQNKIVESFPNISILDIERLTARVLDQITKMSMALQFMSFLSLLAGMFVIYSISREQTQVRRWDLNLTKILGSARKDILRQNISEALLTGFTAAVVGVLLSLIVAYILSVYIFEGIFVPDLLWPTISIFLISLLTVLITIWTGRKVMNENPAVILREG